MSNTNEDIQLDLTLGQSAAQRDEQLVSEAKTGSHDAFAELQSLYARRLYNTIVRITKNHEDAEDVLQDTFLRVYLALYSFEGRCSFYTWATRIAMNSALMLLRKRRARPEAALDLFMEAERGPRPFDVMDSSPNPEHIYCDRQRLVELLRSIQRLEPKLQETIQIRAAGECSMREIAGKLGVSVASVKSRLYRARVRLGSKRSLANPADKRRVLSGIRPQGLIPNFQNGEPRGMSLNRYR
jgi:RNA polymerase sigma-70 factor, ECF subfamily